MFCEQDPDNIKPGDVIKCRDLTVLDGLRRELNDLGYRFGYNPTKLTMVIMEVPKCEK